MLLILVGMVVACLSFWWDWHSREYIHAVPMSWRPEAAATAEAEMRARLLEAGPREAGPPTPPVDPVQTP